MRQNGILIGGLGLLVVWLSGCVIPSPTAAPSVIPSLLPSATPSVTPTAMPMPTQTLTATPVWRTSPTLRPTATPFPTFTPTVALDWQYWPNATDFRAIAADHHGDLWLGALSGLVRYRPVSREWQVWTTADGLPDTTVESVVIWHGEVWIGTQGGIGRFDPQVDTWRSYTLQDGLPGMHNIHLYLDEHADTLWAGTTGGPARYRPDKDRWQGERDDPVQQIWADANALWVSVSPSSARRGGLYRLDKEDGLWQDVHLLPDSPPVGDYALTGNEHTLWAVDVRGGIYACDLATRTWQEMNVANRIDTLFQHPTFDDARLWLLSNARLVSIEIETGKISRIPYPEQPYFYPQYHPVWIGSTAWIAAQSGLYALKEGQWYKHTRTNPPAQITALIGSDGARLLINTSDGPGFFEPRSGTWTAIPVGETSSPSWSVATSPAQETGWAFDPRSRTLVRYDGLASGRPITLPEKIVPLRLLPHIAPDGRLWFVGRDALIAFDPSGEVWRVVAVPNATRIEAAVQADEHIWLIRDGNALIHFDGRRAFEIFPIPYGRAWRGLAVTAQNIWLGGEPGRLLAFEPAQRRWQELMLDTDCPGSTFNALAADLENVWVGGEAGVWHLEHSRGTQTCLTVAAGMLDNRVEQIVLTDDGRVWFFNRWRGIWGYGPLTEVKR